jgi:hypothetical protein
MMTYFDLLCIPKYFDRFLNCFDSNYGEKGQYREPHYGKLINRYYKIDIEEGISYLNGHIKNLDIDSNHVIRLINDNTHISNIYESLRIEFGMGRRSAKLVSINDFTVSIQDNQAIIERLANQRLDSIPPGTVPTSLLTDLKTLFFGLQVVPQDQKSKIVAVSKALHFLLPDLVMPIDGANILRFFGKGDIPGKAEQQFEWFKEVFIKYVQLIAYLKLERDNCNCNWWNISVPKRIDNSITGFWMIFNNKNIEALICNHIEMFLNYLKTN